MLKVEVLKCMKLCLMKFNRKYECASKYFKYIDKNESLKNKTFDHRK